MIEKMHSGKLEDKFDINNISSLEKQWAPLIQARINIWKAINTIRDRIHSVSVKVVYIILSCKFHPRTWGRRDLNPHDRLRSTDFHPFVAFTTTDCESTEGFKDWTLPLPSTLR
ncbi:hypothetical protein NIES4071_71180 [Calothrix sp. NIES-4071]|nr:hypothetical protein NIES4071_71180 [Calothrix sp. NIES-4071]BAZ61393.1 hypothetical protein NIES4105_71130 [Calothrix sp. NIES-4105]